MGWMHPAAVEYQHQRWMRPDAARWFKPVGAPSAKCASSQPVMSAEEFERELESIRREYLELKAMLAVRKFERIWAAFCAKAYNPDQPRVPAGNSDGGRWTLADTLNVTDVSSVRRSTDISSARRNKALEVICLAQYATDTFHCTMVGSRACHAQAAERFAACLARKPIPPLNY
jgi:hypothetical protein